MLCPKHPERAERSESKHCSRTTQVQHGSFIESWCPKCLRFSIGSWSYQKPQARFGHLEDLRFVKRPGQTDPVFFAVPKYRSYFAVEIALLQHITDTLNFSGGSLQSAVLLWARKHSGPQQHNSILGPDHTMLPHVTVKQKRLLCSAR